MLFSLLGWFFLAGVLCFLVCLGVGFFWPVFTLESHPVIAAYDVGTPWDWFVLHNESSSPDEDHKKTPVTSTSV